MRRADGSGSCNAERWVYIPFCGVGDAGEGEGGERGKLYVLWDDVEFCGGGSQREMGEDDEMRREDDKMRRAKIDGGG